MATSEIVQGPKWGAAEEQDRFTISGMCDDYGVSHPECGRSRVIYGGRSERLLSAAAGVALGLNGLSKRKVSGLLLAAHVWAALYATREVLPRHA
jgi:hypothetical protein